MSISYGVKYTALYVATVDTINTINELCVGKVQALPTIQKNCQNLKCKAELFDADGVPCGSVDSKGVETLL